MTTAVKAVTMLVLAYPCFGRSAIMAQGTQTDCHRNGNARSARRATPRAARPPPLLAEWQRHSMHCAGISERRQTAALTITSGVGRFWGRGACRRQAARRYMSTDCSQILCPDTPDPSRGCVTRTTYTAGLAI